MSDRTDHSLGDGVYYSVEDYVGFGPRLLILVIDSVVTLALLWVIAFVWANTMGDVSAAFIVLVAIVTWLYLAAVKRSPLRTVGYRFARCRLVTLQGERPSLFMMTFRMMFWILGPLNLILDFIWCGIDQDRQTLRDRYAGVCVVRGDASPIGEGPIHLAYYDAMGYNLLLAHVVHAQADESDATVNSDSSDVTTSRED